jgi:uncharacterized protein YbjT (DUF2867 family)
MSKVFIIGANGKVGKILVNVLNETNEYDVTVGLRKEEQFSYFEEKGAKTVYLNLEDNVQTIADTIKQADVVVFSAGSGGKTGADKTLTIDLDGAVKAAKAAESNGAKQFIMVSTVQADMPESWSEDMKAYFIAKHYADRFIKESGLNYTILRPGALSDEKGTGKITTDPSVYETARIPREDVARVIIEAIGNEKAYRKVVTLLEGNDSIDTLFK